MGELICWIPNLLEIGLLLTVYFSLYIPIGLYKCVLSHGPRKGGVDPRGGYVTKILYVKTKESGPIGGACAGHAPLNPPMERQSV